MSAARVRSIESGSSASLFELAWFMGTSVEQIDRTDGHLTRWAMTIATREFLRSHHSPRFPVCAEVARVVKSGLRRGHGREAKTPGHDGIRCWT